MKRYHVRRENGRLSYPDAPAIETPTLQQYHLDGRLHRPDGPAVLTSNGTRAWYWRGVRVPRYVIEDPRCKPVQEILNEPNAEVRRVWLEAYGLEDALIDLGRLGGAKVINQTTKPPRRLWEITSCVDIDEQHPRYVEVSCTSTDRKYFLRVPSDVNTAADAVAWTFDVPVKEYNKLTVET